MKGYLFKLKLVPLSFHTIIYLLFASQQVIQLKAPPSHCSLFHRVVNVKFEQSRIYSFQSSLCLCMKYQCCLDVLITKVFSCHLINRQQVSELHVLCKFKMGLFTCILHSHH